MSRNCKWCDSSEHTQFYCFNKPHKPIATRRRLRNVGKVGQRTATAVAKWKKIQPSNHQGYWTCYMCNKQIDYLMAEHVKSKARHPELRTDPNNFKPTCAPCNEKKRSNDNPL